MFHEAKLRATINYAITALLWLDDSHAVKILYHYLTGSGALTLTPVRLQRPSNYHKQLGKTANRKTKSLLFIQ